MPIFIRLIGCVAISFVMAACTNSGHPEDAASPKPSPSGIRVETVTIHKVDAPSELRQTVRFARVTGLPDQTVADRMNRSFRESAETALDTFRKDLLGIHDDPAAAPDAPVTTAIASKVVVGLVNAKVVAVEYRFSADGGELGRIPDWSAEPITLDVADGHRLTAGELLAPRLATDEGAREFSRVLAASGPGGRLCDTTATDVRTVFRHDELIGDRSVMTIFPTASGVGFRLGLWKLGFPMSCNGQVITVGYPKLRAFLGSKLLP